MTTGVTELPGLDCGLCGFRKCDDLAARLPEEPALLARCIHLGQQSTDATLPQPLPQREGGVAPAQAARPTRVPLPTAAPGPGTPGRLATQGEANWQDSLGRDFDFYLEHFPEEPGPREIILPHNPLITRELDIRPGDLMIGRPLGMSCGCPITHCGVAMKVDQRTGVIDWCVTGPLRVRQEGFKDLGYYIAEGYEGLIRRARVDVRIGLRYYFQPRMCMLQWRHSGLVNYLNKTDQGLQVRLEGLWIG